MMMRFFQSKALSLRALTVTSLFLLLSACFANNNTTLGNQGGVVSGGVESRTNDVGDKDAKVGEGETTGDQLSALEVEILSDNPKYTLKKLKKDNLVFIDRPYFFSDTSNYEGFCTLQTAMNDKREEGASFLRFTTSRPVTVYVGYDTRTPLPMWLSDWTDTGDELIMADDNARYWPHLNLRLFKRGFPKGLVELGGNGGAGSMYVILLENKGDSCTLLNDKTLELSWYPNQDKIDGYNVYVEKDAQLTPFLSIDTTELADPKNPSVTFRSWSDLGVTGNKACFSISAYLGNIESDLSISKCINM